MDQNKYPSILTTEELEDYNNEISSVHSLDRSVVVEHSKLENSKLEKSARKRAKSSTKGSAGMINLLEEKSELDEQESTVHSSKETNDDSISELNQNADQNQIDLEPGGSFNLTSDRAQFYVKGLRSGSTYLCTLYAINSRGISKAVVLIAQTLAAPESNARAMGDGKFCFCLNY